MFYSINNNNNNEGEYPYMSLIQGKAYWFRAQGQPHPGFDKSDPKAAEWSFDLALTPETKAELIANGIKSAIKNKNDDRGDFITFKRRAYRKDGTPAKPIRVVDHHNALWDGRPVGNGSTINVSYTVNEIPRPGGSHLSQAFSSSRSSLGSCCL